VGSSSSLGARQPELSSSQTEDSPESALSRVEILSSAWPSPLRFALATV
jgi:hypothetical protein